jgi:hypothetical protein
MPQKPVEDILEFTREVPPKHGDENKTLACRTLCNHRLRRYKFSLQNI